MKKIKIALLIILILVFSLSTVFAVRYKGDINGDNKRDLLDIRLLLQEYISNDRNKSAEELKARDMNNDSIIDILDVRLLLQQYINDSPLEEIKTVYPYTYSGPICDNLVYEDNNIKAWVERIDDCYVTKIWVRDASRQLKKAESNEEAVGLYDDNPASSMHLKTVEQMMQGKEGAVVAFNASGFNLAGSWEGQKKYGGNWDRTPTGHVIITNGVLRRNRNNVKDDNGNFEKHAILGIVNDGTLKLFTEECDKLYDKLVESNVVNTIHFNHSTKLLISEGKIMVNPSEGRNPRTAFGQVDNHNYVVITPIASRYCGKDPDSIREQNDKYSKSEYELAEIGKKLNCKTLYNCDGGGSSTLWFRTEGTVHYGECMEHKVARKVSDAVYFTN